MTALQHAVARLRDHRNLDEAEAESAVSEIMTGTAPDADVRAFLVLLRERGETAAELSGAVRALRATMRRLDHPAPERLVDTCGTGGGRVTTVNVSTAAAFVAAGSGVPIAKHGNRSHTSRSGSADVLEAAGLAIDLDPDRAAAVLESVGLVFLFAPVYHPAMRYVSSIRRELGVPTIMNLVGPLANPAGVSRQVIGVADPALAPAMAGALLRLGVQHAVVVHGEIGLDEIAPTGRTAIWEVRDGSVRAWSLDPAELGWGVASLEGLEGGSPEENARAMRHLFADPASASPAFRAAVVLNAAAAIYVAGRAATLGEAAEIAREALESGAALQRLDALLAAAPR